jgi:dTDP-4-dehydrorhamnose 3,5-epimerase
VNIRELSIPDSYEITPRLIGDDRGLFLESFKADVLREATGRTIDLAQTNTSVSTKGTVRGIHFADIPPSQAKYVTAHRGAVLDFVIDIRVGSPTFGQWDSVLLDDVDRRAIFISEGLGHCFVALTDDATVNYLVTDVYRPDREHGINPLDPAIGLTFPEEAGELLLSPKDTSAPSLEEARAAGILPDWEAARAYYDSLSVS